MIPFRQWIKLTSPQGLSKVVEHFDKDFITSFNRNDKVPDCTRAFTFIRVLNEGAEVEFDFYPNEDTYPTFEESTHLEHWVYNDGEFIKLL